MTQFHTDEYIEFLHKVTPDNMDGFEIARMARLLEVSRSDDAR